MVQRALLKDRQVELVVDELLGQMFGEGRMPIDGR